MGSSDSKPGPGPAHALLGAATDDLDAQCRGIGTSASRSGDPSARAAHRAARHVGPPAGAGVFAEVPVARATLRDGDGPAARPASRAR
jgi:hypothetical protein